MNVLIFGATGTAGGGVLRACLSSPAVEEVRAVTRRPIAITDGKLRTFVHGDYQDYVAVAEAFAGVDACLFCLGVSVTQVSEEGSTGRSRTISLSPPHKRCERTAPPPRFTTSAARAQRDQPLHVGAGEGRDRTGADRTVRRGLLASGAIDAEPSESAPLVYRALRPLFRL